MHQGDNGGRASYCEGLAEAKELALPLTRRCTLDRYSGQPIHKSGYCYWTMQDVGIVRAPDHEFDNYEEVLGLESVPVGLEMNVGRGLLYWEAGSPEPDAETAGRRCDGLLVDESHRRIKFERHGHGGRVDFEGLSFGTLQGKNEVGVFSAMEGVQWSETIEMEFSGKLTVTWQRVSRQHRRAVLVDNELRCHVWDVDTGERQWQLRLLDLGLEKYLLDERGKLETDGPSKSLFANDNLSLYGAIAVIGVNWWAVVGVDILAGELVWVSEGAGGQVVTEEGRVLIVAPREAGKRVVFDYWELDARTGETQVLFRDCQYEAGPDEVRFDPADQGVGAVSLDATRTHCWVTGRSGICYAINRQTGRIDWWWQDPDGYDAAFMVLVWQGALFLYGSDLLNLGARTNVLEPIEDASTERYLGADAGTVGNQGSPQDGGEASDQESSASQSDKDRGLLRRLFGR